MGKSATGENPALSLRAYVHTLVRVIMRLRIHLDVGAHCTGFPNETGSHEGNAHISSCAANECVRERNGMKEIASSNSFPSVVDPFRANC